ncbi:type-4 ice-structuring protein LS-12 [Scomber japonicus]|uniref:type-4 ice-structuring protein LS-12 n=1 Tax=Scomber japonicus TaxID=13676 RepID=UPI0023064866|nr:type-4 ice-structuring protein LS-12 [Scomber japonicus]
MKFSLVAALVVVLAVAHGTESVSLVKRDAKAEVEKVTKFISEMTASITTATQDVVEKVKALKVVNTADNFVKVGTEQIQPLIKKVQSEVAKLQEQAKPFITNIEDQFKPITDTFVAKVQPLVDNLQAQVDPLTDIVEKLLKQVTDSIEALLPPQ